MYIDRAKEQGIKATPENLFQSSHWDKVMCLAVPELPRKQFKTQKEAEDFISSKTDFATNTKYHSYQLPGGEPGSYRELLLTLPQKNKMPSFEEWSKANGYGDHPGSRNLYEKIKSGEVSDTTGGANQFKSSHWDEPNVLAHARVNDREIPGVGKSLHIEEIQSDWHQAGRKQGYKVAVSEKEKQDMISEIQKLEKLIISKKGTDQDIIRYNELTDYYNKNVNDQGGIPNAPFKKTWDELTLKRMIKEAADNGYDAISWTPGEAQAARYDLSKQIEKLHYAKTDKGYLLAPETKEGREISINNGQAILKDKLADYIGKEIADKIIKGEGKFHNEGIKTLENVDLKVGGEGMKAFYDKMMVDKVNQLAKKFGGKVETKDLNKYDKVQTLDKIARDKGYDGWSFKLTDAQREEILKIQNEQIEGKFDKQPIHVLKLTPELKKVATEKGFPLFTGGLQFPKPLEQPTFDERWRERVPEGEMPVPAIKDFPTNYKPPERFLEKRPVRLVKVDYDPWSNVK